MKRSFLPSAKTTVAILLIEAAGFAAARADLIELTNGDHYRGVVISMSATNLDFQSEIQGLVKLPRSKIAQITLHEVIARPVAPSAATRATNVTMNAPLILSGANSATVPAAAGAAASTPTSVAVVNQMQAQGIDPRIVQQLQEQVFGKGSPESSQKFNQMMGGLMSGNISVQDVRQQAQSAINQIKSAQKELGPDAGGMLDGYLDILQKFVADAATDNTITGATTPPK